MGVVDEGVLMFGFFVFVEGCIDFGIVLVFVELCWDYVGVVEY